jgi:hypothetical protein
MIRLNNQYRKWVSDTFAHRTPNYPGWGDYIAYQFVHNLGFIPDKISLEYKAGSQGHSEGEVVADHCAYGYVTTYFANQGWYVASSDTQQVTIVMGTSRQLTWNLQLSLYVYDGIHRN